MDRRDFIKNGSLLVLVSSNQTVSAAQKLLPTPSETAGRPNR